MKKIITVLLFLVSPMVFADQKSAETALRGEELSLMTTESKLLTSGELSPGLHDLLAYDTDIFVLTIRSKLLNSAYTFGEAPDYRRIDAIIEGYKNLQGQLVRDTNPLVPNIQFDFVNAQVKKQYAGATIAQIGCELESWTYTFDNSLNPSSRFLIAQVAYQKKGESFTRIDHIMYREPYEDGSFKPELARIEIRLSEWVKSIRSE